MSDPVISEASTPTSLHSAAPSAPAGAPVPSKFKRVLRALTTFTIMFIVAWTLNGRVERPTSKLGPPAGFRRGMIDGALMPCAMPILLVGRDITVYAPNNTGRMYKLGYTVGVNLCGALFFGGLYWRVARLKKSLKGR